MSENPNEIKNHVMENKVCPKCDGKGLYYDAAAGCASECSGLPGLRGCYEGLKHAVRHGRTPTAEEIAEWPQIKEFIKGLEERELKVNKMEEKPEEKKPEMTENTIAPELTPVEKQPELTGFALIQKNLQEEIDRTIETRIKEALEKATPTCTCGKKMELIEGVFKCNTVHGKKIEGFPVLQEIKLRQILLKTFHEQREPVDLDEMMMRPTVVAVDPAHICMIKALTDRAKILLHPFVQKDAKYPRLNLHQPGDPGAEPVRSLYSMAYIDWIMEFFAALGEDYKAKKKKKRHSGEINGCVTFRMNNDFPIEIANDEFVILLAPRIED